MSTTTFADYLASHKMEVGASASVTASPRASTSKLYYFIAPPVSRSSSNTSSASTSSGKPSRSNSTSTSGRSSRMSTSDYSPSEARTTPSPSISSMSSKAGSSDSEAYFARNKRSKRGSTSSLSSVVLASPPSSPRMLASSPPRASPVQESGCKSSCRCTRCELGDFVFDNEAEYRMYLDILTQAQKDGTDLSSSSSSPTSSPVLRSPPMLSKI